jgi:hypothetical protein
MGRSRADVDVTNIQPLHVPVELRLELGPVVGLHHLVLNGSRRMTSSMNWIAVR